MNYNAPQRIGHTFDLFEEILRGGAAIQVRVTGGSMRPFLRGGEIVTIRPAGHSSLRVGDLLFFRSGSGCVLHRLVRKKRLGNGEYVFRTKGDALISCDGPVSHADILGRVTAIERAGTGGHSEIIDMESSLLISSGYLSALSGLAVLAARRVFPKVVRHLFRIEGMEGPGDRADAV